MKEIIDVGDIVITNMDITLYNKNRISAGTKGIVHYIPGATDLGIFKTQILIFNDLGYSGAELLKLLSVGFDINIPGLIHIKVLYNYLDLNSKKAAWIPNYSVALFCKVKQEPILPTPECKNTESQYAKDRNFFFKDLAIPHENHNSGLKYL